VSSKPGAGQTAETVDEGRTAIESRLAALGRVHDLLLRTSWGSVKLAELLEMATTPFDTPGAGQFLIQSTNIDVSSGAALPLAMTLNELCTNAVKHGALSVTTGSVKITTKVDKRAKNFRLTWTEKNGPAVQQPTRRSFGLRLIEQSFVGQLQGSANVKFSPSGIVCRLDVPLAALQLPESN
jgi:two-component sensor histidine kinase